MVKANIYNTAGEKIKEVELNPKVFDIKVKPELIQWAIVAQQANRRKNLAHTKDRSEVRGGGRKPWRQKGTGRARHGSRRSPLWRGGGTTFGPTKERNFKREISRKMRRKALFIVLSAKAKDNSLFVLDDLVVESPKTKLIAGILNKLPIKGSCLIILPKRDEKLERAAANLKNTGIIGAKDLNVMDLLSYKYAVLPKEGIKVIKETFAK